MFCALDRWTPGRMKRKPNKDKTAHPRQRRRGLRLRSHAAAKGFAACEEREIPNQARGFERRRANSGLSNFRRVRPFRALFHIGELIAQCGDAPLGKSARDRRHDDMCHSRARTMRQHIASARVRRHLEQARDPLRVVYAYDHRLWSSGTHAFVCVAVVNFISSLPQPAMVSQKSPPRTLLKVSGGDE